MSAARIGALFAAVAARPAAAGETTDVVLELRLGEATRQIAFPLGLTIRNLGRSAVFIDGGSSVPRRRDTGSWGAISLEVRSAGRPLPSSCKSRNVTPRAYVVLRPGGQIARSLAERIACFDLGAPGAYTIVARFVDHNPAPPRPPGTASLVKGPLVSNTVTVVVSKAFTPGALRPGKKAPD